MEALRLIAETTNHQVTIELPPGMDAKRVEIIVGLHGIEWVK